MYNLAVCDKTEGAVFEITAKNLFVRRADEGICVCTNHFRVPQLATSTDCPRFQRLDKSRDLTRLGIVDVAKQMHEVNQGAWTQQTMVFETSPLTLHLAFGRGPASRLPLNTVELAKFFHPQSPDK